MALNAFGTRFNLKSCFGFDLNFDVSFSFDFIWFWHSGFVSFLHVLFYLLFVLGNWNKGCLINDLLRLYVLFENTLDHISNALFEKWNYALVFCKFIFNKLRRSVLVRQVKFIHHNFCSHSQSFKRFLLNTAIGAKFSIIRLLLHDLTILKDIIQRKTRKATVNHTKIKIRNHQMVINWSHRFRNSQPSPL